jgi:hypothetical protein
VNWLLLDTLLGVVLLPAVWRAWRALGRWARVPDDAARRARPPPGAAALP